MKKRLLIIPVLLLLLSFLCAAEGPELPVFFLRYDGGLGSEEIESEVRITVTHEVAHHFGIDDDTLHELGW